jgi:hypothetical protein
MLACRSSTLGCGNLIRSARTLVIFIVPILAFFFGLGLLLTGAFRRPRGLIRIVAGSSLVFGIAVMGARAAYIDAGLDLNPVLRGAPDLAGTWRHGATTFVLSATGSWHCLTPRSSEPPCGGAGTGHWNTSDFAVNFVAPNGGSTGELRVVTYRGAYRLVHPFGDPDDWDYSLDFERVAH